MMISHTVPFVANTADDTHCLQAAYMSIAKYFDPHFDIPMDKWSELTGYEEGLGTWANAGLVWFNNHGYEVKHIELFDFAEFIKRPREYMIETHGKKAGKWGYEHTNVPSEIKRIKEMLGKDIIKQKEPNLRDIQRGLEEGYLARVTVNSERLNGTDGYIGHAVVITGYDDESLILHDPGLPALPNRRVLMKDFEAAWSDQGKELDLIRRP